MPALSSLTLLAFGLAGILGTWGRAAIDGTLLALVKALHSDKPYVLPGTKSLLSTSFTGIYWPVDYLLDVLVVFWWEAVDGSHPATSAIALYFLGQYFSILTAIYTDGFRHGNAGRLALSPPIWLTLFQALTVGCLSPLWAFVYLASSPLLLHSATSNHEARALSTAPRLKMLCLPGALVLGYAFPAALMALPSPSVVSNEFQQRAIATWNFFPIWVASIQKLLEILFTPFSSDNRKDSVVESQRSHLNAVRLVSAVAIAVSSATHIIFVSLTITARVLPTVFSKGYANQFSFSALFVPPISVEQVRTVGDGVRSFIMWDQAIGYTVLIGVFSCQLLSAARLQHYEFKTVAGTLLAAFSAVTFGPGATVLGISWARDELLFADHQAVDQNPSHKVPLPAARDKTS